MRTRTRRTLGITTLALGAAGVVGGLFATPASAVETTEILPGNPSCEDLGYAFTVKFDATPEGAGPIEVTIPAEVLAVYPGLEIVITDAGNVGDPPVFTLDFAATQDDEPAAVISAVVLKQSEFAKVYRYDPPVASGTVDVSGIDPSNDLSHVSFCLNAPVVVTTTTVAETTTTPTTATPTTPTTPTTVTAVVAPTQIVRETAAPAAQPATQVAGVQLARTGDGDGALAAIGLGLVLLGGGAMLLADDWRGLVGRRS